MSVGYVRKWPPLLEAIKHVQEARGCAIEDAWRELQPALYEGRIKSRFAGARYEVPRHHGIQPHTWYQAVVIADLNGAVIFDYDGRKIVTDPAHPNYRPMYQVEICWADVLRYWPEDADARDPENNDEGRDPASLLEPKVQSKAKTKKEKLRSWIATHYGDAGPPTGTTAKRIALDFKSDTGIDVNERTVRRARGRL